MTTILVTVRLIGVCVYQMVQSPDSAEQLPNQRSHRNYQVRHDRTELLCVLCTTITRHTSV